MRGKENASGFCCSRAKVAYEMTQQKQQQISFRESVDTQKLSKTPYGVATANVHLENSSKHSEQGAGAARTVQLHLIRSVHPVRCLFVEWTPWSKAGRAKARKVVK